MWSLNARYSDRQMAPETSGPRPKVLRPHFYSFHCQLFHLYLYLYPDLYLYRCSESGSERPLTLLDISRFFSALNFMKSLRNQ
jgi:hypothetical protein